MKKIFIFLLLIFLCTYFFNIKEDKFYSFFSSFYGAEFCYILNDECYLEKGKNNDVYTKIVKNGTKKQLYFKNRIYLNKNPDYKQVSFNATNEQIKGIIKKLNIKILFKEKINNTKIYYGFSASFKNCKLFNNHKINFQFVVTESKVLIGYPMVYTGF